MILFFLGGELSKRLTPSDTSGTYTWIVGFRAGFPKWGNIAPLRCDYGYQRTIIS